MNNPPPDAVLSAGQADDVLALSTGNGHNSDTSDDPYWRAINRDAIDLTEADWS